MSIYDITVKNQDGVDVSLADYKGKVLLFVNTATECGFTPQYEVLQELYDKYGGEDFEILDFPCDQFGHQAPGSDEEIHAFCSGRFGVTFPQFSKIEVNGENTAPIYTFLKEEGPDFAGFGEGEVADKFNAMLSQIDPNFADNNDIKWNFTKFLVDKDGKIVERFEPMEDMAVVEEKISEIL